MISVLIPTRGRVDRLRESIFSLIKHSGGEMLEFVLRTDEDETPVLPTLDGPCREIRGERYGYAGMHRYYNELAAAAAGDFLLIWNDDIDMLTEGWDKLLVEGTGHVQFLRRDIRIAADDSIPFVRKSVFDALGHLSQHCFVDTWLSRVAMAAGVRQFRNDIIIRHHRLEDETSAGREAAMRVEYPRFRQLGVEQWADVEKLRAALKREYI